jgi:hypothetical protein
MSIVSMLLLSISSSAQKAVSFPAEDGGLIYADNYGVSESELS